MPWVTADGSDVPCGVGNENGGLFTGLGQTWDAFSQSLFSFLNEIHLAAYTFCFVLANDRYVRKHTASFTRNDAVL